MAEKMQYEPFAFWKEMYEQTEKAFHEVIQTTLGKESFSESLGQVQNSYLQYQDLVSNFTDVYFKQANFPTADDLANVASLVIQLEEKVDKLDDQLFDTDEKNTSEIASLKEVVTGLDGKLNQILASLSSVEAKLEQVSATAPTPIQNTPPQPPKKKPTPRKKPIDSQ